MDRPLKNKEEEIVDKKKKEKENNSFSLKTCTQL
jgi:hypothetical protein